MMPISAQELAVAITITGAVEHLDRIGRTDDRFRRWPEKLADGFDVADSQRCPLAVLLGSHESALEMMRALPLPDFEVMSLFFVGNPDVPSEMVNNALSGIVLARLSNAACS